MPKTKHVRKNRKPAGRLATAATVLPLAIGLGSTLASPLTHPAAAGPPVEAVTDPAEAKPAICEDVNDVDECHSQFPAGCNAKGNYDATLSFLKNRIDFPTVTSAPVLKRADFAGLEQKIPKGVTSGNHSDFVDQLKQVGEGEQRVLVGFLYPSKEEKAESSNCELQGDESVVDFHLYVGFDPDIAQQLRDGKVFKGEDKKALNRESVIVEMTPHFREHFQPDWTFANISKLIGRQVKVVGQLLLDNEHNNTGQNCGLPGAKEETCFRASAWELHPVTQFFVCPTNACAVDSTKWLTVGEVP